MAQENYAIADSDGATFLAKLNDVLEAVGTTNKGSSRPATINAGMMWIDDNSPSATVWTLNLYDGTDDIAIAQIDTASNIIILGQAADQAAMEAAASATRFVTPGLQHHHPSAAKFWVLFNGFSAAIAASYNVTSVTDNGTGDYTVNFAVPFSSTAYAAVGWSLDNGSGAGALCTMTNGSRLAGSVGLITPSLGGLALADSASVNVIGYGDQ